MNTRARRQSQESGWFWMEDEVIDRYGRLIGAIGVAIYAYLARRADRQGMCYPSYNTIAADLHLSRRTVITYIRKLAEMQLIVAAPRMTGKQARASNVYCLVNLRDQHGTSPSVTSSSHPTPSREADDAAGAENKSVGGAPPPTVGMVGKGEAGYDTLALTGPASNSTSSPASLSPASLQPAAAPVLQPRQHGRERGAIIAPDQEVSQAGAADAPRLIQQFYQGGAVTACEGNTGEETHFKETQEKGGGSDGLARNAAQTRTPASPSPLTDLLMALYGVTGKDPFLLRKDKRCGYEQAAGLLQGRGYGAQDVRDFAEYWLYAHPIGSRKPSAGRPHLVQVLEDLPAAREWMQARQARQAESAGRDGESPVTTAVSVAAKSPADAAALAAWQAIAPALQMRLMAAPAGSDLTWARPLSLAEDVLTVQLPDAGRATLWQERLQRPVSQVVAQTFDHPLTVRFVGPEASA